jgi:cbb3-type cytochrome oxidase subunit 3
MKIRKSVWVPLVLLIYSIGVMVYALPRNHEVSTAYKAGIVALDLLIVAALWWIYRKKEHMAKQREDDLRNNKKDT